MDDVNQSVSWGIFAIAWLLVITRWAYNAGVRKGREEKEASLPPRPPPPMPPRLAERMRMAAAAETKPDLRDGMTVEEVATALGVAPDKFSESLRRRPDPHGSPGARRGLRERQLEPQNERSSNG